jgi:hypothetical protein
MNLSEISPFWGVVDDKYEANPTCSRSGHHRSTSQLAKGPRLFSPTLMILLQEPQDQKPFLGPFMTPLLHRLEVVPLLVYQIIPDWQAIPHFGSGNNFLGAQKHPPRL